MIEKNPKMHDSSGVTKSRFNFLRFLIRSRKIHFRGCFAFLGNDGILELFTLNARILEVELDYCDLRYVS